MTLKAAAYLLDPPPHNLFCHPFAVNKRGYTIELNTGRVCWCNIHWLLTDSIPVH